MLMTFAFIVCYPKQIKLEVVYMNAPLLEQLNLLVSWALLPLMLLLAAPAFTRFAVKKLKLSKDHWLARANKFLHKQHIRLSVVCLTCMLLHIVLSFVALKHFPLLGYIIVFLFALLGLSGHLKKKFFPKWFALHRKTSILILIAVVLHILYETP